MFPSQSEENQLDLMHLNAVTLSQEGAKSWKCFHCGETGHRSGRFCPRVKSGEMEQTAKGMKTFADWCEKFSPQGLVKYDIKKILFNEKEFWRRKGKDVDKITNNYLYLILTIEITIPVLQVEDHFHLDLHIEIQIQDMIKLREDH